MSQMRHPPALVGSGRGADGSFAERRDESENSFPPDPFQRLGVVAGTLLHKVAQERGLSVGHALALADAGLARGAE